MRVVLLGGGGTGASFAVASRIRANWGKGVKLILTDIFNKNLVTASVLADKFFKVPIACAPGFREAICDIILAEGVQTYIPILNDELILAANLMKDARFSHVDFWSSEIYASCTDKLIADSWLNKIGVRTPKRVDLVDLKGDVGPWFLKPRNGYGSHGVQVIRFPDIINIQQRGVDDLLIQELCENPEITVDSFYDVFTDTSYAYCRERLETKAGVCTKARLFANAELSEFARKIGKALRQCGVICFQVMKSKDGWAVTDLNLRSGAGTAMTCAAGYDVISASFACRIGEDYSSFLRSLQDSEEFYITRQYSEFVMEHKI